MTDLKALKNGETSMAGNQTKRKLTLFATNTEVDDGSIPSTHLETQQKVK